MASFFNFARFGRQNNTAAASSNNNSSNSNASRINRQPSPTPTSPLTAHSPNSLTQFPAPQIPFSPPHSSGSLLDRSSTPDTMQSPVSARRPPYYFREDNSGLIVKGNFMTLAAQPEHVEKGEWLAHQVVEQYRLLEGMLKIVQEVDARTNSCICNAQNCPQMTAPNNTIYTWLDSNKNPVRIPAVQYTNLVQKWIMTKITDPTIFPTDTNLNGPPSATNYPSSASGNSTPTAIPAGPTNLNISLAKLSGRDQDWTGKSSGFPQNFEYDIKSLYRQMFRCYAHLYYAHWLEPFYHLGLYKELNTCFIHFVNVGKQFDLLADKDLLPMQPLVDIWLSKQLLPMPQSQQEQASHQSAQQGTPRAQQEAIPAAS